MKWEVEIIEVCQMAKTVVVEAEDIEEAEHLASIGDTVEELESKLLGVQHRQILHVKEPA